MKGKQIIFSRFPSHFSLFLFLFLIVNCYMLTVNCFAFDFSLRPKGFVFIPMGGGNAAPDGSEMYSVGGGGDIGLEIDLSTIWPNPLGLGYTLGVEGGMTISPFQGDSSANANFYSFGGVLSLYYFSLSRLFTRIDGAIGVHQSAINAADGQSLISEPGLYWRAGGEIGFRFSPGFLLAANAGWKQYNEQSAINNGQRFLNSGFYAGLTAQLTFQAGRGTDGVHATLNQYGAVYPAFMQIYQNTPIGNVVIRNNENAEIRDVRLSFRAGSYTSSEFFCGSVPFIPRGLSGNIPLFADFSSEILRFTDNGRIMGELVIRYKFLGQERETVRAITIASNDRNRITAGDIFALTAFISPTSPETLDFARFIAGLERINRRIGHNQNMNHAIWLLEGLRASQITVNSEQLAVSSGVVRNHNLSTTSVDSGQLLLTANCSLLTDISVQFPSETLLFSSGNNQDLVLLFSACLEGVGISSALIEVKWERDEEKDSEQQLHPSPPSLNSELLTAVSLNINAAQAETLFNGTDRILIINDNVWLPLSMSELNEGFMACWNKAVTILNEAFASGGLIDFVIVEDAWQHYPPAPMVELGRGNLRTDNNAALREVNTVIQRYITQEINPVIQRTSAMQNSAAQQNRLGILYVRAGRIAEAKAAYERAAGLGSVPAMTNRGNLALTERDFTTAERWFRQALQGDPQNRAAHRGLERIAVSR
ncbi:MAG: hypothetical protein FWD13_01200 [Treponema sp.]|nr:hypothetical protein [Treponema sp.]